jgi:hypothetical protein
VRVQVPTDDPGRLVEVLATAMEPLQPGASAQLLLRPGAIGLCPPLPDRALARGLVRVAYRGSGYSCVVALGETQELTGVPSDEQLRRGAPVGVRLDPAGTLAFRADASEPAPPLPAGACWPAPERDALVAGSDTGGAVRPPDRAAR